MFVLMYWLKVYHDEMGHVLLVMQVLFSHNPIPPGEVNPGQNLASSHMQIMMAPLR